MAIVAASSAASSSTTITVTKPSGTVDTDIMVAFVGNDYGTYAALTAPAGWALLTGYDGGTNKFHLKIFTKTAASEGASYAFGQASADGGATIVTLRDVGPVANWLWAAPASKTAATTYDAATVAGAVAGAILLTYAGAENSTTSSTITWTPPSGMTEQADTQSGGWWSQTVASLVSPPDPSGAKTFTPSIATTSGAITAAIVIPAASVAASGGSFFPFLLPPNGGGAYDDSGDDGGGEVESRDPLQQPFLSTSIWNQPIGDGATYAAAGMGVPATYAEMPGSDPMRICLTPDAPATDVRYSSAGWSGSNRCSPTSGTVIASVAMPTDYVVPNSNKNECAAFLAPDGHTVKQVQPLARCTAGQPATSIVAFADEDLYGAGTGGAQGGSGLSALGGTLRLGELRPGQQGPPHALKVIIATGKYLFKATTNSETYRWPATKSDSGAVGYYGSETNNSNTNMRMGSLLALHPSSTLPATLRTEPGRQLAWTLQNYGAYIVDGTGDDFLFATEEGYHGSFLAQFNTDWGYAFDRRANETHNWVSDVKDIVAAFQVITNNAAVSVGGGGTPRVPLAPSL